MTNDNNEYFIDKSIAMLQEMNEEDCAIAIDELRNENARLRAERDEARREVCDWHHTDESGCVKSGSEETAIKRGWDCFKNQVTT
jgi:hypothetical protein